jgi:arsenate reductase-like glutaredoxin family protein
MYIIFGKKSCEKCQKEIKRMKALNLPYTYYDLNTKEGLAEMAIRGISIKQADLPIIIEDKSYGVL